MCGSSIRIYLEETMDNQAAATELLHIHVALSVSFLHDEDSFFDIYITIQRTSKRTVLRHHGSFPSLFKTYF